MSKYSPYFRNQLSRIRLPLLTILTLGSWRSCLQNCTSFPTKSPFSCKKGSPPEKFIFSIPDSFNKLSPLLASSIGRTNEVFAVWKQNPHL
uniref:Uncharacterized protein n=1 Tax=Anguilla anguilla TaxID=7936 RepID=A0A0E9XVV3_ANGAN